uniref:Uncharacterized protein n=1 Tax=Cannabis sativa TaxID=3483 RepID=A0A803NT63_CANSA
MMVAFLSNVTNMASWHKPIPLPPRFDEAPLLFYKNLSDPRTHSLLCLMDNLQDLPEHYLRLGTLLVRVCTSGGVFPISIDPKQIERKEIVLGRTSGASAETGRASGVSLLVDGFVPLDGIGA